MKVHEFSVRFRLRCGFAVSLCVWLPLLTSMVSPAFAQGPWVPTDLGTLGGSLSWASDVNDAGQVVGFSTTAGGPSGNNTTSAPLHGLPGEGIVLVDRDTTGKDEVLIDFGTTYGLWQYTNDTAWSELNGLSPEGMVSGGFH